MIWQTGAAEEMSGLLAGMLEIDEIKIGGSLKNPTELDVFSDVDMEIFIAGNTPVNIKEVLAAVSGRFAPVFGYEVISHSRKDVIRLCLENGMRFDLLFRYSCDKEALDRDDSFAGKVDAVVNQFWFIAALVLAKLGRRDNLIAAHLALEAWQLVVVVQMLERDNKKGTSIHRFGDGEAVPVLGCSFIPGRPFLDYRTAGKILGMVYSAAGHMDEALQKLDLGYARKGGRLHILAEQLLEG